MARTWTRPNLSNFVGWKCLRGDFRSIRMTSVGKAQNENSVQGWWTDSSPSLFFFNLNRINSIYNFNTRFNMWTIPYNPLHSPISDNFSFQFSEIQQNLLYLNSLGGHTWYNILRQSSVISPNQLQLFENMWTELKKKKNFNGEKPVNN